MFSLVCRVSDAIGDLNFARWTQTIHSTKKWCEVGGRFGNRPVPAGESGL